MEGISEALAGAVRFGGGVLADGPSGRQKIAVGGYTTTAGLGAATAGATAVWQVGLLRAAAWTTRGLRIPARNALLADIVPAKAHGRAYGLERMMGNLGAIFGPLLAFGLVAGVGVQWAIGLSVIPGLLAAAAIVYASARHPARPAGRRSRGCTDDPQGRASGLPDSRHAVDTLYDAEKRPRAVQRTSPPGDSLTESEPP
ncbi:MFS transporter [Streptomyces jeddahensis]|uniref:Major facilitator superfamily protein n=1 Tax=Streptomyces jeddahensis TaxID=1716141 RepID=A0A177HIU0_9ACTN|nr:MFS transporter [Streptomyces jeddahensis]OAH10307.1 major facilitator superfamily protein [Streptomyces jeddahensis]